MLTVPDALVPVILRAMRANRTFVTADGARRRIRERQLRPQPFGPPPRLSRTVRIEVAHDPWPVYTFMPRSIEPVGGVVYVHGGGWVNQIVGLQWRFAAQLAVEARTTVSVPIYPLVPFGTAADAVDGVARLVRSSIARFGRTALVGDSAGGQIALSTALALRDEGVALPRTVLISPALDLTWSNPRIPIVQPTDPWLATPGGVVLAEAWRGGLSLRDPAVSPLFGDLRGLGPISLYTGTRDVLNPDAHLLATRAQEAGVDLEILEAPGQVHVYPILPTRTGDRARDRIAASLRV
ncbi:alpha/beta hydrolase fold domain-containing protein [Microbacterium sp. P04]|uniref:alpha/beta hydrolase fold domain-containing protein n=1 Tax=Microbacterium sp. P04 TaxID=3366947 RepID=UPI00374727C3